MRYHQQQDPEQARGVGISDGFLKGKFGDAADEGLVVGGLDVTDNVKAFLRLDPKYKVYGRLQREEFLVEV